MFFKDSPFVTQIKYFAPKFSSGKSDFDQKDLYVENLLLQIKEKIQNKDYMNIVKEELIFLSITDISELKFTIYINQQEIKIERDWDMAQTPTVVLPLKVYNLEFLNTWLEKGHLNKEELHRVIHTVALSAVESFYKSKMLNKLKNPRILRLHKLIHLELKNPLKYEYQGEVLETKITVMNVLGQFIILPGHIGVAPVIFKANEEEALEYYTLLRYKLPFADSLMQKKQLFDEYMQLRAKTVEENPEYK